VVLRGPVPPGNRRSEGPADRAMMLGKAAASAEQPTGPGMSMYKPPTCCWRRPTVASEGLLRRTSVPHAAWLPPYVNASP